MNDIFLKAKFGSHLYGTDTPESDTDYKGLYLPSKDDLVHMRAKKCLELGNKDSSQKNTKDDVDYQVFSVQYFIELCARGDMVAFDLLHAPDEMIIRGKDHPIWVYLRENRAKFYSKNIAGYLGYIGKQVNKYGHKGSRVASLQSIISMIESASTEDNPKPKFGDIWDKAKDLAHAKVVYKEKNGEKLEYLSICGKFFDRNTPLKVAKECFTKEYAQVGQRAIDAKNNENVDWKAVSHAVRACIQVRELLAEDDITLPLKPNYASAVKNVKAGNLPFAIVSETLSIMQDDIFRSLEKKDWPLEPDLREVKDTITNWYFD